MKITSIVYKLLTTIYSILPLKKQICLLIKKAGIPFNKFYKDIRFRGKFKTTIDDKDFFLINYGYTMLENEIFWRGLVNGWEKVSFNLWANLSKNAEVIFDIGANTGIYSLIAKTINPDSKVYAFEPSKRVYEKLVVNNLINNYNIQTEQIALSNIDGITSFYDTFSKHQYSASLSLEMKKALIECDFKVNEYNVQVKCLKTYIEENNINKIDLIKLDVELHEVEVLEGLGLYLDKFNPTFFIEILNDELARKIEPYFINKGYLFFNIDEENGIKRLASLEKNKYYNFLICRDIIAKKLQLV